MNLKGARPFLGPLFVVGMPRSGTKLLRSLLMNHPQVSITHEADFVPWVLRHWDEYQPLASRVHFQRFYRSLIAAPYIAKKSAEGLIVPPDLLWDATLRRGRQGLIEAALRYYAGTVDRPSVIWGDKAPTYIKYIKLLKQGFPDAKFIHIVRDPRDGALSAQRARKRSILRYAQKWVEAMEIVEEALSGMNPTEYIECRYEDLIKHPERTMRLIFELLGVEFQAYMAQLSKPAEKTHGDAAGIAYIKSDNTQKYKDRIRKSDVHRVEQIASKYLVKYGYECSWHGPRVPLSKIENLLYIVSDNIYRVALDTRRVGIIKALRGRVAYHRLHR